MNAALLNATVLFAILIALIIILYASAVLLFGLVARIQYWLTDNPNASVFFTIWKRYWLLPHNLPVAAYFFNNLSVSHERGVASSDEKVSARFQLIGKVMLRAVAGELKDNPHYLMLVLPSNTIKSLLSTNLAISDQTNKKASELVFNEFGLLKQYCMSDMDNESFLKDIKLLGKKFNLDISEKTIEFYRTVLEYIVSHRSETYRLCDLISPADLFVVHLNLSLVVTGKHSEALDLLNEEIKLLTDNWQTDGGAHGLT